MSPLTTEIYNFLWSEFGVQFSECPICKVCGRGMQAGFGDHTAGQAHFKHLKSLYDQCSRDVNTYWQKLRVPGGGYRFNHATGELHVCRTNLGESLPVDPAEESAPPLETPLVLMGAAPLPMLTAGTAGHYF